MVSLSSSVTQGPYFRTYGPYFQTSSKSLNGRKIARMAPILTIFGPNRSQRRNLFFEKFSNERRRHRGIVVVVIVAVVVAVVVVIGRFWVACIKGTSLLTVSEASLKPIGMPAFSVKSRDGVRIIFLFFAISNDFQNDKGGDMH